MSGRDTVAWALAILGGLLIGLPSTLDAAWSAEVRRSGFDDPSPLGEMLVVPQLAGVAMLIAGVLMLVLPVLLKKKPA